MSDTLNQLQKIEKLLKRKQGCTMLEVSVVCYTTTPGRRLSDLRERGWTITKRKIEGKSYHRFFGLPPDVKK